MPLVIDCVLIDCVDLDSMTTFWCQALDLEHVWTGPSGGHLHSNGRIRASARPDAVPPQEGRQEPSPFRSSSGRSASRSPTIGGTRGSAHRHRASRRRMGGHGRPGGQRVLRVALARPEGEGPDAKQRLIAPLTHTNRQLRRAGRAPFAQLAAPTASEAHRPGVRHAARTMSTPEAWA